MSIDKEIASLKSVRKLGRTGQLFKDRKLSREYTKAGMQKEVINLIPCLFDAYFKDPKDPEFIPDSFRKLITRLENVLIGIIRANPDLNLRDMVTEIEVRKSINDPGPMRWMMIYGHFDAPIFTMGNLTLWVHRRLILKKLTENDGYHFLEESLAKIISIVKMPNRKVLRFKYRDSVIEKLKELEDDEVFRLGEITKKVYAYMPNTVINTHRYERAISLEGLPLFESLINDEIKKEIEEFDNFLFKNMNGLQKYLIIALTYVLQNMKKPMLKDFNKKDGSFYGLGFVISKKDFCRKIGYQVDMMNRTSLNEIYKKIEKILDSLARSSWTTENDTNKSSFMDVQLFTFTINEKNSIWKFSGFEELVFNRSGYRSIPMLPFRYLLPKTHGQNREKLIDIMHTIVIEAVFRKKAFRLPVNRFSLLSNALESHGLPALKKHTDSLSEALASEGIKLELKKHPKEGWGLVIMPNISKDINA